MFPPNTWIFDAEIENAIPTKDVPNRPGYRYCKHWGDHAGMGVACVVIARPDGSDVKRFANEFVGNIATAGMRAYDGPLHLSHLWPVVESADLLVGYGSRPFDAKLLAAYGLYINPRKHLDLLFEVKKSIRNQAPKGWKLHDVSLRCGGPAKTASGADAPFMWQDGRYQEVIDYCANDIQMICAVVQRYILTGGLLPAPDLSPVRLRTPQQIALED